MSDLRNPRQWESVTAPVQNRPGERSPYALRAVVAQFDVEDNPRYQPRKGPDGGIVATYCNIFATDVTAALHAEIPHWVPANAKGARRELNVNATMDWLLAEGVAAGWREVLKGDAELRASAGYPTVAIWKNPNPQRSGHIAVLLPSKAGEMRIAQAGKSCLFDVTLVQGFGVVHPIRFFTND